MSEAAKPSGDREPLRAAGERTGSGPVPVVGALLALLALALGVVLVRDALVVLGALGGEAWLAQLVDVVAGTAPATWLVPVGVAVALVGVSLLSVALGRRTRTEVRLASRTAVTTEPRDVARLSSSVARDVDGVLGARTSAGRRSVVVRVSTTGDPAVPDAVQRAVAERLGVLQRTPSVRVRVEGDRR
ncbi:DUF6286 domain-containing protein [Pseudokineococcus basanitobsidens]|uniref:DUF6286 domain-containing protein n=1 Tax=Pseudokineococcus basanitobsidens TaxID=1926649 RepID=A0ABU8RNG9_9ACTN